MAIERADRAATRERGPRRLPVRRGNRAAVAKQNCNDARHASRTTKRRSLAAGVLRSDASAEVVDAVAVLTNTGTGDADSGKGHSRDLADAG